MRAVTTESRAPL